MMVKFFVYINNKSKIKGRFLIYHLILEMEIASFLKINVLNPIHMIFVPLLLLFRKLLVDL